MTTKILILETPNFKPDVKSAAATERVDPNTVAALLAKHKTGDPKDSLLLLAPAECRNLPAFTEAFTGPANLSTAFFSKAEEVTKLLTSLAFLTAERSTGVKECLTKGSQIYSESFYTAQLMGQKIDPIYSYARRFLPPSAAVSAWGSLQSLVFLGLQSLPLQGERSTGERIEAQIGSDENIVALSVKFDLAKEQLAFTRSSPLLLLPRDSAGLFESRYIESGKKIEFICLFFRKDAPSRAIELLSYSKDAGLENMANVKEFEFHPFAALSEGAATPKAAAKTGGFKKKFSEQMKSAAPETPKEEPKAAPAAVATTVVVSGDGQLGAKPAAAKDKGTAFLEGKIESLEATIKQREELVQKLNKEIDELKDPTKRPSFTAMKDSQVGGLSDNAKRLEAEIEEGKSRERELIAMVDKAVKMKDEAMKKVKEYDIKLKQSSGGNNSKTVLLEKQVDEQKRQNKEMAKRMSALIEQIQQAGLRPAA